AAGNVGDSHHGGHRKRNARATRRRAVADSRIAAKHRPPTKTSGRPTPRRGSANPLRGQPRRRLRNLEGAAPSAPEWWGGVNRSRSGVRFTNPPPPPRWRRRAALQRGGLRLRIRARRPRLQAELLQPAAQRARLHAQQVRGAARTFDDPLAALQRSEDVLLLNLLKIAGLRR